MIAPTNIIIVVQIDSGIPNPFQFKLTKNVVIFAIVATVSHPK